MGISRPRHVYIVFVPAALGITGVLEVKAEKTMYW